jgi:hypothetical protein
MLPCPVLQKLPSFSSRLLSELPERRKLQLLALAVFVVMVLILMSSLDLGAVLGPLLEE